MVAGAEQRSGARVPDGESVVAQQPGRALLPPTPPGAQEQRAVRQVRPFR